jgi:hypothetical protein
VDGRDKPGHDASESVVTFSETALDIRLHCSYA